MPIQPPLCLVAGKSGGHIVPALSYAHEYRQTSPDTPILFFSTDAKLDTSIVLSYPFISTYVPIKLDNFPRKKVWRYPAFIWHLINSFLTSIKYLWSQAPKRVISMGGYISIPVCLSAWLLRIPIELFELNASPGQASLFLAKFATKISVCFEQALNFFPANKTYKREYPLRFTDADRISKNQACIYLGLDPKKKVLLVLGGSQGSHFINNLLKDLTKEYAQELKDIQILHQTGDADVGAMRMVYADGSFTAQVFDYKNDLQYCYSAADLVIARAGAGTLFELAFFSKKSIIIPLEADTTTHQLDNALAMAQRYPDLFIVLNQSSIKNDHNLFLKTLIISI